MSETQDTVVVERPRPEQPILRLRRGRRKAMDMPAMSALAPEGDSSCTVASQPVQRSSLYPQA